MPTGPASSPLQPGQLPSSLPLRPQSLRPAPPPPKPAPRPINPAASIKAPEFSDEIWAQMCRLVLLHVQDLIRRYPWRGAFGGVLPDGYDAESITSEVIGQVLREIEEHPESAPQDLAALKQRLRRLSSLDVYRLFRHTENFIVHNEPDLHRARNYDGEPVSPIDLIPDPGPNPLEQLTQKSDDEAFEELKARFQAFLGHERRLITLLELRCAGFLQPQDLARRLKLSVRTVETLPKRLQRRYLEFLRLQNLRRK